MPSFVDDGYTRDDGFIAAAKADSSGRRLYDELSFTYRVATRREVITLDAELRSLLAEEFSNPKKAIEADQKACEFIVKHLAMWSLVNREGKPVPVVAASLSGLNGVLFDRLYSIIRGSELSDVKEPATVPPPSNEDLEKN